MHRTIKDLIMADLSIKVDIAGRTYPLSVKKDEEENVRKAAGEINESLKKLKSSYPMTDMQDLLSMASLEVVTRYMNSAGMTDRKEIELELNELEKLLGQDSQV